MSLLNDKERGPDDQPSIGIILCAEKDDVEDEYALRSPVATFLYQAGIYGQKGRTLAQFRIYGLEVIPIPSFDDSEIKEISSITKRIFTETASAQEIKKLNAIVLKGYGLDPAGSKAIEEFLS